jgi:methyl-accepting chemotaxis protein
MSLKTWSIARRINVGLGFLLLLFLGYGIQGLWRAYELQKEVARLADDSLPSVMLLSHLESLRQGNMIDMLQFIEVKNPERRDKIEQKMAATKVEADKTIAGVENLLLDDKERVLFAEFKRTANELRAAFSQLKQLALSDTNAIPSELIHAVDLFPKFEAAQAALQKLVKHNDEKGVAASNAAKAVALAGMRMNVRMLVGCFFLTTLLSWVVVRSIKKSLRQISLELEQGATQTAAAARQIAGASQSLSSGASEQASSVEETGASLEQISSLIQATAENAQRAKSLASETREAAEISSRRRLEARTAMAAIDASNSEVAKIVKDIDEIAFQTNILALNAAVEAARAGEAGAGFAVVADEVRSLAQRSAAAAKATAGKIETALKNNEEASRLSQFVGDSLQEIAAKVATTDSLVGEIATAAREQAQGIEQINQAIGQIDRVAQGVASSAGQTAAAAEQMDTQAGHLKDQVAGLRQLIGGHAIGISAGANSRVSVDNRPPLAPRIRRTPRPAHDLNQPKSIPMPGDRDMGKTPAALPRPGSGNPKTA